MDCSYFKCLLCPSRQVAVHIHVFMMPYVIITSMLIYWLLFKCFCYNIGVSFGAHVEKAWKRKRNNLPFFLQLWNFYLSYTLVPLKILNLESHRLFKYIIKFIYLSKIKYDLQKVWRPHIILNLAKRCIWNNLASS